jgi:hypothetical protein
VRGRRQQQRSRLPPGADAALARAHRPSSSSTALYIRRDCPISRPDRVQRDDTDNHHSLVGTEIDRGVLRVRRRLLEQPGSFRMDVDVTPATGGGGPIR